MIEEIKKRIDMIKAGEIPEGYKLTNVGVLPLEWSEGVGHKCFSFIRNGFVGIATPYYVENGIKYIQGNNIKNGRITEENMVNISYDFHNTHKNSQLKNLDIIVVQSGTVGDCAIVGESFEGANCHAVIIMTPKNNINSLYYSYMLNSSYGKSLLNGLITGNTIQHILSSDMKKLRFPLPPKHEQEKIAEIIATCDKVIELKEKLIAKKQQQKRWLMQKLLSGNIRINDYTDEWKKVKLKNCGFLKGGTGFPDKYQGDLHGDFPFYKVSDMNSFGNEKHLISANNYIKKDVLKKMGAPLIKENSIVFAKVGAALLLDRKRILTVKSCIDNNMMAFTPNDKVYLLFAYYLFLSIKFAKLANIGALPSINIRDVSMIAIELPSIPEQVEIANIFTTADSEIELMQKDLAEWNQKKKALMQLLLTGKVRV